MNTLELVNKIESFYLSYGYLTAFLGSFIEITPMGWIIPGGLILAMGGFFAYGGGLPLVGILISGWLGAWLTFLLAFFLGKKSGMFLVKKLKQEKNAVRAKRLLEKHGGAILTTSMMANLTRFWVAYIAGVEDYSLLKFLFYSGTASLTWVSLMVVVGYLAGAEKKYLEKGLTGLGVLAWVLAAIAVWLIYKKSKLVKLDELA